MVRKTQTSDDDRPVRRRAPTPPGRILKEHYLKPRGVSQVELAQLVGRSEKFISQLVNDHGTAKIDLDLAVKLSRVFSTTPALWLNMQAAKDAWAARNIKWKPARVIAPPQPAPDVVGA